MTFSKIFILGAGAIGSVYGALLSERNDVTLIGNKAHMETIKTKGLSITGDVKKTFHPKINTEIISIPKNALIVLATKTYDSAKAIEGVKRLLKKDTVILILQNGLGNEEIIKRIVNGRAKVLRGITKMASEFLKPGKIRFWTGETIIEPNEVSAEIVRILNESNLKARLSDDFDRELWTKLVVNCVVNPLTALFHVKNSTILEDSLKTVRHGIVKECVDVANAEGIALPENLAERIDERVSSYTNLSSMYQDIAKGKKTEIDFLNGKIVDLGKKHHIQTPISETLVSFIKFLEGKNGISRKH